MSDLARCVTHELSLLSGRSLQRVIIRALDGEVSSRSDLADPMLYLGGEVCLECESRTSFVSWVARDGWDDHFSIAVRAESLFKPGASLCDWDVSNLDPWSKCVRRPLQGARVFSFRGTPHVVELSFGDQTWWMADGFEQSIGDGDDLLIRSGSFPASEGAKLAWTV